MTQSVTQSVHHRSSAANPKPRPAGRYLQRRGRVYYFRKRLPGAGADKKSLSGSKAFFCASLRTDLLSEAYERAARLLQTYEASKRRLMLDMTASLPDAEVNSLLHALLRRELDRIIAVQGAPSDDDAEVDAAIATLSGRAEKIRKDARRNEFADIQPLVAGAAEEAGLELPADLPPDLGRRAASLIRELLACEANVLDGDDAKTLAAPIVAKVSTRSVDDFVAAPVVTVSTASAQVGVLYPSPDMRGNNAAMTKLALAFFGDVPVSAMTKDRQKAFFGWIARLPKLHGRLKSAQTTSQCPEARRALKDAEIQAADEADAKAKAEVNAVSSYSLAEKRAQLSKRLTPRLTLTTLRRYRDSLQRLFRAAEDLENPDTPTAISYRDIERMVKTVDPDDPLDLRVTRSKTRDPWTEERLAQFLSCPIYTGCFSKHRRWRPGNCIIRDAFYWVPLIVLTIGSRIKEIVLLKRDNLRLRNGVHCLAIGLDADQNGKSEAARRYVPIPQLLLDLGFVEWIKALPKNHGTLLFPEAAGRATTTDVVSPFSKALSRGLASMGIRDFDEDFYALRKTFQTMLSDADVKDGERQAIAGHARQSIVNRHYTAFKTRKLKQAVDSVDFAISIAMHPKYKFPVIEACNLQDRDRFTVEASLADDEALAELAVTDPESGEVLFAFARIDAASGQPKPDPVIHAAARKFDALVGGSTMKMPKNLEKRAAIEAFHALA